MDNSNSARGRLRLASSRRSTKKVAYTLYTHAHRHVLVRIHTYSPSLRTYTVTHARISRTPCQHLSRFQLHISVTIMSTIFSMFTFAQLSAASFVFQIYNHNTVRRARRIGIPRATGSDGRAGSGDAAGSRSARTWCTSGGHRRSASVTRVSARPAPSAVTATRRVAASITARRCAAGAATTPCDWPAPSAATAASTGAATSSARPARRRAGWPSVSDATRLSADAWEWCHSSSVGESASDVMASAWKYVMHSASAHEWRHRDVTHARLTLDTCSSAISRTCLRRLTISSRMSICDVHDRQWTDKPQRHFY